jgi:hypothetical protein
LDEVEFSEFYSQIKEKIESTGEGKGDAERPDSRIELRKWIYAAVKIQKQIDNLKNEYIPWLKERYTEQCNRKVKQHEQALGFVKDGILSFMEDIGEKSQNFPDLATASVIPPKDKLIYPEDEGEIVQRLKDKNPDLVKTTYKIDKKAVNEYYKDKEEVPDDGISIEEGTKTVRITPVKIKENEKE